MRLFRPCVACSVSLLLFTLTGCSGAPDDAPEIAPVRGKVTRQGQPFAGVTVTYTPQGKEEGVPRSASYGVTNEQGDYELVYNINLNGAVPGKHVVTLRKDDGVDDIDERKKAPEEIVIPSEQVSHEVEVPAEGLDGGAANFDLDF